MASEGATPPTVENGVGTTENGERSKKSGVGHRESRVTASARHMNIQNISYKGVDYTKENYDESFPLLGCLHDQQSTVPRSPRFGGGPFGKRLQKQSPSARK